MTLPPKKKFYNCIKECDLDHKIKSNYVFILLNCKNTEISFGILCVIDLWQLFPHVSPPICNFHL